MSLTKAWKILLATIVSFTMAATASAALIQQPTGFYVMQASGHENVKDSVILSSKLRGFHVRQGWDVLEAQKGVYNWGFYDTEMARAARLKKYTTLAIYSGTENDPTWGNSLDVFTKTVAAFGARYGNNPWVDAVHMSAPQVTTGSAEMYLPGTWSGTDQQAINIWKTSIDAWNRAFPNKVLILDLAMAPNSKGAITKAVDEYARSTLGERFNAEVDNLKASTSKTAPHIVELNRLHSEGVRIGFEFVSSSLDRSRFGGTFLQGLNIGQSMGGSYYQVYQQDVPNIPSGFTTTSSPYVGGRLFVNSIPEPSTAALLMMAGCILGSSRRGRRQTK
jgi:hypothetical protein